jgi:hypothetical protein
MSDVAEKAAEATAEVVEETVDGVVEVMEVVRNNPAALVVVGFAAASLGVVGGYLVAKRRLKSFYEDLATQEIAEAKEFYAGVYKTDPDGAVLTPMEVLEQRHPEAAASLREYQGVDVETPIPTEATTAAEIDEEDERLLAKTETRVMEKARIQAISVDAEIGPGGGRITEVTENINVFEDATFDLEEERKHRTPDKPYIITHDEFFAGDREYETSSLTYFEDDDTLVDERDNPVPDIDATIGEDHLVRFGSGSKDKNIVYVRNDRLQTDFEITLSKGSYLEEVLGLGPDPNSLKHSDQRDRRRAFRHGEG